MEGVGFFLDDPTFSASPAHKIAERLSSWMPEHLEAVYVLCYANDEWRGWKVADSSVLAVSLIPACLVNLQLLRHSLLSLFILPMPSQSELSSTHTRSRNGS